MQANQNAVVAQGWKSWIWPVTSLWNWMFGVGPSGSGRTRDILVQLEDEYGDVHPTLFQGTFLEAIQQAKEMYRFLVVYLHSRDHEDTPAFCRSVLFTPGITEYFDNNFVFWAGDINTVEGATTNRILNVSTYPYIGTIYAPDNGPPRLIGAFYGMRTVDELLSELMLIQETSGYLLSEQRIRKEELEQSRILRDEQDKAFNDALEADRERERKAREEQERVEFEIKAREEEERRLREEEEQRQRAEEEKMQKEMESRRRKQSELPVEPPEGPETVQLAIKLPSGQRLTRRFLRSNPIQIVYNFIDSQQHELESEKYELVCNYPRKIFSDKSVKIQDSGIDSNALLFIQEILDEEEDP